MRTLINKKTLIVLLLLLFIIFVGIPLGVSLYYGNIPFYNNNSLESYDVLVSNDENINESELTFIKDNTYTWAEIKDYVIRNQMTFPRVFRNTVILICVAIVSVMLDRFLFRRS
ncbi:hypothetical protein [Paraliobacillus zengyii]|uniref:hypothetical protein n=1 Tax=Paraliobacillus zengyii TaxID=2213194 RepID=UPI000DD2FED1|nr:hypothetical protein [Paraliobacillus zengyii]